MKGERGKRKGKEAEQREERGGGRSKEQSINGRLTSQLGPQTDLVDPLISSL